MNVNLNGITSEYMDLKSIDHAVQPGVSLGRDILTVYHGSENIIKQPVYGKGVHYNDYGRGFYMTRDNRNPCI